MHRNFASLSHTLLRVGLFRGLSRRLDRPRRRGRTAAWTLRVGLPLALAGGALACAPAAREPSTSSGVAARPPEALTAALAGRPALVSLWATWCEACSTEFGALNRLDARAKARHSMVLGVAVGESSSDVRSFAARRGLRYAQIADERFEIADALGERRIPTTLVIDRSGRIVFRGGVLDEAALRAFERVTRDEPAAPAASAGPAAAEPPPQATTARLP